MRCSGTVINKRIHDYSKGFGTRIAAEYRLFLGSSPVVTYKVRFQKNMAPTVVSARLRQSEISRCNTHRAYIEQQTSRGATYPSMSLGEVEDCLPGIAVTL
jgi:hypothetical protein